MERVKLAYDADEAGDRAAKRDAKVLESKGLEVFRIRFPAGMDVNEYSSKVTPAAKSLRHAVDTALWLGKGQKPEEAPAPSSLLAANSEGVVSRSEERENEQQEATKKKNVEVNQDGEHWQIVIGDRRYRVSGLERNAGFESLKITLRLWFDDLFHLDTLDLCLDAQRKKFIQRAAEETTLDVELIKRDLGKLL